MSTTTNRRRSPEQPLLLANVAMSAWRRAKVAAIATRLRLVAKRLVKKAERIAKKEATRVQKQLSNALRKAQRKVNRGLHGRLPVACASKSASRLRPMTDEQKKRRQAGKNAHARRSYSKLLAEAERDPNGAAAKKLAEIRAKACSRGRNRKPRTVAQQRRANELGRANRKMERELAAGLPLVVAQRRAAGQPDSTTVGVVWDTEQRRWQAEAFLDGVRLRCRLAGFTSEQEAVRWSTDVTKAAVGSRARRQQG